MEKFKFFIILFVGAVIFYSCETTENIDESIKIKVTPQVKASSFNIRFNNPADGVNNWDNRKEHVVSYLQLEELDIIGMQEVLNDQLIYLRENLPGYTQVGVGREDGDTGGEYAPVFFDSVRFTLESSGTFWLSETPDQPSVGWDAVLERICTYAYLTDLATGEELHVYNTHYDHIGSTARTQSSQLIMDYIQENSQRVRVLLMGDLNAEPDTEPYSIIQSGGLEDSFESEINFGPVGTWNGFNTTGPFSRRIDYIFFTGFKSKLYKSDDVTINGNYLSDHFPVISILEYRPL